jgi:hypothetical protein
VATRCKGRAGQLGKSRRQTTRQEGVDRQAMQANGGGHNAWGGQTTQGEQVAGKMTRLGGADKRGKRVCRAHRNSFYGYGG